MEIYYLKQKKIRHPFTSKFYKSVVLNSYLFFQLEFVHECYFERGKGGQNVGEHRNVDVLFCD